MKTILLLVLAILNISVIAQDSLCLNCPDWAKEMDISEKRWKSYQNLKTALHNKDVIENMERDLLNLPDNKPEPETHDALKIGAVMVSLGAVAQIISIMVISSYDEPGKIQNNQEYKDAVRLNRKAGKAAKTISVIGYSLIAAGGITMSFSF